MFRMIFGRTPVFVVTFLQTNGNTEFWVNGKEHLGGLRAAGVKF
jgi:hypothetical protein